MHPEKDNLGGLKLTRLAAFFFIMGVGIMPTPYTHN